MMMAQPNENGFVINSDGVLEKYTGSDTSVIIPDGVTCIGTGAFSWCKSLTSVHIPASVTSIGDSAFYNCEFLTSVHLPSSVKWIAENAFDGCDALPDGAQDRADENDT